MNKLLYGQSLDLDARKVNPRPVRLSIVGQISYLIASGFTKMAAL